MVRRPELTAKPDEREGRGASDLVAAALILPGSVVTAARVGVVVITLVIACPGKGENRPYGRGDQDTARLGVQWSMLSLLRSGITRVSHVDSRRRRSRCGTATTEPPAAL
jgi:hypothetical protein